MSAPPRKIEDTDGNIYTYSGKIEGKVIYKSGGDYYIYKNGKLRISKHIKHVVQYGW